MKSKVLLTILLLTTGVLAGPEKDIALALPGIWTSSTESFEAAAKSTDAIEIGKDLKFYNGSFNFRTRTFKRADLRQSQGWVNRLEIVGNEIVFYLDGAEERAGFVKVARNKFKTVANEDPGTIVYYWKQK